MTSPEVLKPILDAHHADHCFSTAGGCLHKLALVTISPEHSISFVLVWPGVRGTDQVCKAPWADVHSAIFDQRLNEVYKEGSTGGIKSRELTKCLAK